VVSDSADDVTSSGRSVANGLIQCIMIGLGESP